MPSARTLQLALHASRTLGTLLNAIHHDHATVMLWMWHGSRSIISCHWCCWHTLINALRNEWVIDGLLSWHFPGIVKDIAGVPLNCTALRQYSQPVLWQPIHHEGAPCLLETFQNTLFNPLTQRNAICSVDLDARGLTMRGLAAIRIDSGREWFNLYRQASALDSHWIQVVLHQFVTGNTGGWHQRVAEPGHSGAGGVQSSPRDSFTLC